jgi:hypothetical protein
MLDRCKVEPIECKRISTIFNGFVIQPDIIEFLERLQDGFPFFEWQDHSRALGILINDIFWM